MEGRQSKRERYLCSTCGVLCSSAGYELCIVILEQVFVEAHVLVFGEYGVICFETVLGEHCFIARDFRLMFCGRWGDTFVFTLGLGYLKGSIFSF